MERTATTSSERKRLRQSLKACPVCDTLNGKHVTECFVCGWQGKFNEGLETISERLAELEERAPDLVEVLAKSVQPRRGPSRFRALIGALFRRFDQRC